MSVRQVSGRQHGHWLRYHKRRAAAAVRRAMPPEGHTTPVSTLGKVDAECVRKTLNTEFEGHRGFPVGKSSWEKIRSSLDSSRALAVFAIAPESFAVHPGSYTNRTLATVADWCNREVNDVTLSSRLEDLYPGGYSNLRRPMNVEFDGEKGFPIRTDDWQSLKKDLTDVADVRDEVVRRAEA